MVPDNQTLLRMLEENEKVRNCFVIMAKIDKIKIIISDFAHVPLCKNPRIRYI